jgi:hypothetical protein
MVAIVGPHDLRSPVGVENAGVGRIEPLGRAAIGPGPAVGRRRNADRTAVNPLVAVAAEVRAPVGVEHPPFAAICVPDDGGIGGPVEDGIDEDGL